MKKNIVLFTLFILPIVAYLFFASGVNSFIKLPVVTVDIPNVNPQWTSLNGEKVTLDNRISILGFSGKNLLENKGNFFTLNQKIYNRNKDFKDFQFVFIAPDGTQDQAKQLLHELSGISDVSKYQFVFASEEDIKEYFLKLKLIGHLDEYCGTSLVYIVDKERNLRGRKGKSVQGTSEYKEGYNTISASELHNEMTDDVKIILAEYRLALKKNNADRQI